MHSTLVLIFHFKNETEVLCSVKKKLMSEKKAWYRVNYLLFDRAAWSKRAFEVSSRRRIIPGDLLAIFPPLISVLYNLHIYKIHQYTNIYKLIKLSGKKLLLS
ncbi:hypothetical protein TorRG33x02_148360 [Trema orientale]|uniref:Uncharacterized protein n=1 Tax=Trema orientale TaxID=63057 RepID=A0A2P5EUS9_TREOI|nr:hypothetical protein TorRG33x02_148360 [Trema orientale]